MNEINEIKLDVTQDLISFRIHFGLSECRNLLNLHLYQNSEIDSEPRKLIFSTNNQKPAVALVELLNFIRIPLQMVVVLTNMNFFKKYDFVLSASGGYYLTQQFYDLHGKDILKN